MSSVPKNSIDVGRLTIVDRKISIVESIPCRPGTFVGRDNKFEPAIALGFLAPAIPPQPGRFCAIVADPNDEHSFSVRVINMHGDGVYGLRDLKTEPIDALFYAVDPKTA
jgi:hypothetical protein